MTYTALSVLAVLAAVGLDVALGTRLVLRAQWWLAYGIVLVFQLVTNGWLTGREIVVYDPAAILGDGSVVGLGHGRVAFAPVEDLGFGFALVLLTCLVWTWLGARSTGRAGRRPPGRVDDGAP